MFRIAPAALGGVVLASLAGACAVAPVGSTASAAPAWVGYARPPRVGATIGGRHRIVRCDDVGGARATAATGFYARGCRDAGRERRWKVVARTHERLPDGGLWLLEVRALDAGGRPFDDDSASVWVPLPWHGWA